MTPTVPLPSGISVVVPVYNSADCLPALFQALTPALEKIGQPFELILVNDSSRDQSWTVIEGLVAGHPWVRGFSLLRNSGQHNALLCGIRAARYDKIVTVDDDLQHPPEEIATLLAKLESGFDVVYGAPHTEQHGLFRDLASQITKYALKAAMGAETARHVSAFRAFWTRARSAFAGYQNPYVSIDVLLTWGAVRFVAVKVRHQPRHAGVSNYTFRKLVTHALNMMTGFSTLPLQFASLIGFACTLFGLGILAYVLGRYWLQGSTVAGFPFLASIIAIFAGAQLFALGIIGEYLARMHLSLSQQPSYVIHLETETKGGG
jgi:glycosyltransferase involved in cell wall biosynthesis